MEYYSNTIKISKIKISNTIKINKVTTLTLVIE